MRVRRPLALVALAVATVLPLAGACADVDHYYANQTPYGDPATTSIVAPPAGYDLVFLETVGRHGSRTMTSDTVEDRVLAVWRSAKSKGKLTTAGQRLDDDLAAFARAEERLGYGHLSTLGRTEWRGIGRRTADLYRGYLAGSAADGDSVAMTTSPVYRTKQSAAAMREGLEGEIPSLGFATTQVDDRLVIEDGTTAAGKDAYARVLRRSSVRTAARHVLLTAYRASFVDSLRDPVGKALDLHSLYAQAAGMRADTDVTFDAYLPLPDARVLAATQDARKFYGYGPGVAGQTGSYRQAQPLLDDFFTQLDRRLAGGRTSAVFRHGHGETTSPFAALARVTGSTEQAPRDTIYSWSTNPWRGERAGGLAGSVEWAAYRSSTGGVLVTMRQNEQPTRFSSRCVPASVGDGFFYTLTELKRCLD